MARSFRRHATPATPEARIEAAAIQRARSRGMTNAQIADRFGINERTVRKIVSGETSGTRIFRERMPSANVKGASPNIFRADIRIGYDPDGKEVIRSVNVKIPDVQGPRGPRAPTFFDVLRLPDFQTVAKIERQKMQNQYGEKIAVTDTDDVALISLRNIVKRDPTKILHTIRGSYGVV